jgi:alkylation response protein AidB-like acyl-CoA dehydrogenase
VDLADSPEEQEFRARLRRWLAEVLPTLPPRPSPADWPARRAFDLGWQRMLYDAGYAGLHWPVDAGGRGATPAQHLIFLEETEKAGAPYVGANFVGLLHAGPTIAAEGTPGQRERWLPPVLRGEEIWCQAWLAMSMDAPGVTVRPLRTLAGSTEFAEVFLDEVRVPVGHRIGAENDGWRVTMVTLSFERGTAFAGEVVACRRVLGELAREAQGNGRWDDASLRRRLGRLNAEFRALWRLTQWNVSEARGSGAVPGPAGSVFKLRYSHARQELFDTAAEVLGADSLDLGRPWTLDRLSSLSYTIAAGTSQIQQNIVAERILGLPKGR